MAEREVNIKLGVKDDATGPLASFTQKFEAAVKALRKEGGKRSSLGEAAELALGRGALGGISAAGEALTGFAEKLKTVKEEFEAGDKTAGQMFHTILESVPVVGEFAKAGTALREAFDSDYATQVLEKKVLEEITKEQDFQVKQIRAATAAHEEQLDVLKQIAADTRVLETPDSARSDAQARLQAERNQDAEDKKAKTEIDKVRKQFEAQTAAASKNFEAARAAAPDNDDNSDEATRKRALLVASSQSLQRLSQQQAEQEAQIQADADARKKGIAERDQVALENLERKALIEREQFTATAERQIGDIQAEASEKRLRDQGRYFEADTEALERHHADRLAEIEAARAKEAREHPEDLTGVNKRAEQYVAAERDEYNAAKHQATQNQADRQSEIDKSLAQGKLEQLRDAAAAGDPAAAGQLKIAELQLQFDERRRALQKEMLGADDAHQAKIKQAIAELDKQRPTAIANAEKQIVTDWAKTGLQAAAAFGDQQASVALKRLDITEQFEKAQRGLQATQQAFLAAGNKDGAAAAAKQIADLKAAEAQALARAGLDPSLLDRRANLVDLGTGSGVGAALRERQNISANKPAERAAAAAEKSAGLLDSINKWFSKIAGNIPGVYNGGSEY